MRTCRRDEARRQPGSGKATQQTAGTGNPATGRPPMQRNGNARAAGQRAPVWPAPKGEAAALDLARALARWPR
jgi:hypothetical protein